MYRIQVEREGSYFMDIRMIALDLDGTTLRSDGRLSGFTKNVLEEAIEKGIHVAIATGRTVTSITDEVRSVSGLKYLITSNGAVTIDNLTGDVISSEFVTEDTVLKAAEILEGEELMVEACIDGFAYADSFYYNLAKRGKLGFRNQQYVTATRTPVDSILDFMVKNKERVENININFRNPEDREAFRTKLMCLENATLTSSFKYNIEIGGKNTSKANALKKLCQILSITPEQIMSFGDSPNDWDMMSISGYPVAVGNAVSEIREKAWLLCPSNDDDGVAVTIKEYILSKM